MGKEGILLAFVKTMNLVDKNQCRLSRGFQMKLCLVNCVANVFDAG